MKTPAESGRFLVCGVGRGTGAVGLDGTAKPVNKADGKAELLLEVTFAGAREVSQCGIGRDAEGEPGGTIQVDRAANRAAEGDLVVEEADVAGLDLAAAKQGRLVTKSRAEVAIGAAEQGVERQGGMCIGQRTVLRSNQNHVLADRRAADSIGVGGCATGSEVGAHVAVSRPAMIEEAGSLDIDAAEVCTLQERGTCVEVCIRGAGIDLVTVVVGNAGKRAVGADNRGTVLGRLSSRSCPQP